MNQIIISLIIIIFFNSCSSSSINADDKLAEKSSIINNKSNDSVVTKPIPMNDKFTFIGDSVLIPTFEIEVQLNDKAEKKLKTDKETIIVQAYFDGIPKDTTQEEFIEWGKTHIGSHGIELSNSRVARFQNVKISKIAFEELQDKNFEVLINVFSGRKSSLYNLLSCEILQEGIETIKAKRSILKGELIY